MTRRREPPQHWRQLARLAAAADAFKVPGLAELCRGESTNETDGDDAATPEATGDAWKASCSTWGVSRYSSRGRGRGGAAVVWDGSVPGAFRELDA